MCMCMDMHVHTHMHVHMHMYMFLYMYLDAMHLMDMMHSSVHYCWVLEVHLPSRGRPCRLGRVLYVLDTSENTGFQYGGEQQIS